MINRIFNEDCLETMVRMPDDFVDLTITSPPYNMNLRIRNGQYCSRQIVKEFSTKYDGFNDNLPIDDFYNSHNRILSEIIRVSKIVFYNIGIVTGSKRAFCKLLGDYADYVKDIVIWDKKFAQPAMQKNVLNRQYELIIIFEKEMSISRMFEKCNFKRGELNDVWRIKRGKKISSQHSAVFPEALVEKIILNFSDKNDLVYDPFLGTGTVAKVAKQNRRNYIGSETSQEYCKMAEKRVSECLVDLKF